MADPIGYTAAYNSYKKAHDNNEPSRQYMKRITRRLRCNELKEVRKKERLNTNEREYEILSQYKNILKINEKKDKVTSKRPKEKEFLSAFAFLPPSQYDKRYILSGLNDWKSHSFNEKRQVLEFFHTFVYPYPIPEALIMASLQEDLYEDENGMLRYSPDFTIIHKSRKWLIDIVSGGSFYRKNKNYFTKAEAHHFLSSQITFKGISSVIEMYFEAKCVARNIAQPVIEIVAKVFTMKFLYSFDCPIVTGFLDLIARYANYQYTTDELGDICDFVNTKIAKYQRSYGKNTPFSFSGRTINSVIALANEWHTQHQREIDLMARLGYTTQKFALLPEKWDGLGINNFRYENDGYIWVVKQLCTLHALTNEGRKMKHCVASYAYKCINNECGIFNVSCFDKSATTTDSAATIEVSSRYEIVQIKGKCNSAVSSKVLSVVRRWAQQERLRIHPVL